MSSKPEPRGRPAAADFHEAVAEGQARGLEEIRFWWRDDDLIADSTALRQLSALSDHVAISPLVAIIPGHASATLADTLAAASPNLWFAQHGFVHANHQPEGAPPNEFGAGRANVDGLRDIAEGRAILLSMRLPRLLDIFVPPWNRLDPAFLPMLPRLGFTGTSGHEGYRAYGAEDARRLGLTMRNAHVDVTQWGTPPEMIDIEALLRQITAALSRAIPAKDDKADAGTPKHVQIGILTHHRVMREHEFPVLEDLFSIVAATAGCRWIGPRDAFL
jgi:hypothetical protein